jgi:hypothetical protein
MPWRTFSLDLKRIVPLLDLEVGAEDVQNGQVGRRLAVRHTVALEPGHPLPFQGLAEFVEEARLPHPRLAHDAYQLAAAGFGPSQALVQQAEFPFAAHQLCEAAFHTHVQPRSPAAAADHPIDLNRLAPSLDRDRPQAFASDVSFDKSVRGIGDEDGSGFGQRLYPRRQVGRVPHCGVVHPQVVADPPDHDEAGVEAQTELELHASVLLELLAVTAKCFLDRQRRLDAAKGVILQGHGRPEEGHQAVPQELIDGSFVAMDGLRHEAQSPVHDLVHGFWVQALRQSGGVHDVAEQHRHLLALALERGL